MRILVGLLLVGAVAAENALAQTPDEALLAGATRRGAAVALILDSPRDTPANKLSAVLTLVDLGEVDVAAVVWKSLVTGELEDSVCADLAEQFGTARLLKLARREVAEEEDSAAEFAGARTFATRCIEAASRRARDPKRLAALIGEVNDEAAEVRKAARVELAATGTDGAQACLEALAQTDHESVRANLMLAITGLKPAVEPLLVAALVDGSGHFRRDVAELCGYLGIHDSVPFLAAIVSGAEPDPTVISAAMAALNKLDYPAPNAAETRALLVREIKQLEAGALDWSSVGWDQGTWWTWQPKIGTKNQTVGPGQFISGNYDLTAYQALAAERLARMLMSSGEPTPRERTLALIYHYETLLILGKQTSDQIADSYSTSEVSNTLAAALKHQQFRAAISCIQVLAARNEPSVLLSTDGRPSPLVASLGHGSRELRFAALEAIMKLGPQRSFAGASGVPKALWEFAAGVGPAQAVAASSVTLRADDWAAQLRELGYDAVPATSGRAALQAALSAPRLELLLVDSDIGRPRLREVVFQLRSSKQASLAPVAVLSSLPNLQKTQRLANEDRRLFAVARPHSELAMQEIVDRLKQLGGKQATAEQRTARAVKAIGWIGKLLDEGHPYDELLRDAHVLSQTLLVPGLVEPSLKALAAAGTTESQISLVDFASQGALPIETRQRGAESFASSVKRFGKQLPLENIHRQYERYNASESADQKTQQVLGQILDVLEGKVSLASDPWGATP